ncbi:hypothetical protein J6Z48_00760 [bacterium]|nr:hypothetical protein [bacterium]
MKGNKKILAIAVLLLLIAVSYSTYAIYKTSRTADAEVSAAAWTVAFKDGSTEITDNYTLTFGTSDCTTTANPHVAAGKIAPGATCSKTVTLDASGTEVDVEYTVTADNSGILVDDQAQPANSNTFTAAISGADGTITMNQSGGQTDTFTVTLTWGGQEGDSYDSGDTAMAGSTITVPLTLTAKQTVGSGS